jgi:hypothetical protein
MVYAAGWGAEADYSPRNGSPESKSIGRGCKEVFENNRSANAIDDPLETYFVYSKRKLRGEA